MSVPTLAKMPSALAKVLLAASLEQALLMLREGVEAPAPVKVENSEVLDLSEEARGTLAALLRDELRAIIREELATARQLEELDAELEEQRRMNTYLKGELERRDKEAEKVSKPWWKLWR